MSWGRRDPLAVTRRENTTERMRRQRETMPLSQVRDTMALVIKARLEIGEVVTEDDFKRANLPMEMVKSVFPAVLSIVRSEMVGR